VTPGGKESFLRYRNIVTDVNVILIVKPDTFADPASIFDVKLPREFHPGSRSKYYGFAYSSSEGTKSGDPHDRTYLPRVRDEQEFHHGPEVDHETGTIPSFTTAWCICQVDHWDIAWGLHGA
jgi:hypothetical protein